MRTIIAAFTPTRAAAAWASADAALPSPAGHAIVVGRWIAAVRIGERRVPQCQAVVRQLSVGDSGASHGGSFNAT